MRRPLQIWSQFWFEPVDAIRLSTFRILFGISLLFYMIARWGYAAEWLTDAGFHYSARAALWHSPLALPTLSMEWLPWFGLVLFGSIGLWIAGWQKRWVVWVVLGCVFYVTFVDRISSYTLNKLYIVSLLVLALAPREEQGEEGKSLVLAWPMRVLQITIVIQYATAGWCKVIRGDWLESGYVLWTQAQGVFCTDIAAWMYQNLPKESWIVMQYSALAFELLVPLLFVVKRLRPIGFLWGFGFQMLIALTMGQLIYFSAQLLTYYVLFFDETTLRRLQGTVPSLSPACPRPVPKGGQAEKV